MANEFRNLPPRLPLLEHFIQEQNVNVQEKVEKPNIEEGKDAVSNTNEGAEN